MSLANDLMTMVIIWRSPDDGGVSWPVAASSCSHVVRLEAPGPRHPLPPLKDQTGPQHHEEGRLNVGHTREPDSETSKATCPCLGGQGMPRPRGL